MTRELAGALMISGAAALIALGAWAWYRRRRRDSAFVAPVAELPDGAVTVLASPALYVATTRHDEPLERLAIRGLGFRSAADVTVTDAGVALDLTGQPRVVITRDALVGATQSTVAIDKVVERDGLVRITWHIDPDVVVDTYLRPQGRSARGFAAAIQSLVPEPAEGPTRTPTDGPELLEESA